MGKHFTSTARDEGEEIYYTDDYLTFISSHLRYITNHPSTRTVVVDPTYVHKNLHDFDGLMMDMGIRYEDIALMRVINNMANPLDLTEAFESMILPDNELIDQLKSLFRTTMI